MEIKTGKDFEQWGFGIGLILNYPEKHNVVISIVFLCFVIEIKLNKK